MSDTPETSDNILASGFGEDAAPTGQVSEPVAEPTQDTPVDTSTWFGGFSEETQSLITKKGFDKLEQAEAFEAMSKSYSNLESMRGVPDNELFHIKPDMDEGNWGKVYDALGRPESSDKYSLQAGEGDVPELVDWLKGKSHELGFNDKQVSQLYESFNETMMGIAKTEHAKIEAMHNEGLEAIKTEWQGKFDQNANIAGRAAEYLGLDADTQQRIKDAGLAPTFLRAMQKVGTMMGEGEMAGASPNEMKAAVGAMTKEEAQIELDKKLADPQFQSRRMSGDPRVRQAAMKETEQFYKILAQK